MFAMTYELPRAIYSFVATYILQTIFTLPLMVPNNVRRKFNFSLRKARLGSASRG